MVSRGNYMKAGLGVQQDLVTAYAWFSIGASKSVALASVAATNRDEIARQLSREQIAKAQEISLQLGRVAPR